MNITDVNIFLGTSQAVMPIGDRFTVWEVLAAYRIAMRNIEITATTYIDGGVCCLSGRTAAYRTEILRDPQVVYFDVPLLALFTDFKNPSPLCFIYSSRKSSHMNIGEANTINTLETINS